MGWEHWNGGSCEKSLGQGKGEPENRIGGERQSEREERMLSMCLPFSLLSFLVFQRVECFVGERFLERRKYYSGQRSERKK